jgi:hypothetical protein
LSIGPEDRCLPSRRDHEPSLGAGAISYFFTHSRDGSIDAEGDEHDGREPEEDDESPLGWDNHVHQIYNMGGSMHADEMETSLGSTATINQKAWAFGLSNDREQGTQLHAEVEVVDRQRVLARWLRSRSDKHRV